MFGTNTAEDYVILNYLHSQIMVGKGDPWGQRDPQLTKAAIARPFRSAFGEEMYQTTFEKAAALVDAIINRVVFKDGNKRTALAAAALYLARYEQVVSFTVDEAEAFTRHIVLDHPPVTEIADWLQQHTLGHRLQ